MQAKNLDGGPLRKCSPSTGYKRDGYCAKHAGDVGVHTVCAVMDANFLDFTATQGNDLVTPSAAFPGLNPGDHWCLCAGRYMEALRHGKAPQLVREATDASFFERAR